MQKSNASEERSMRTKLSTGRIGRGAVETSPGSITMLLRSSLAIGWCIYTSVAS